MKKVSQPYQSFLDQANLITAQQKQNGGVISPELARMGVNAFSQFALPKVSVEHVIDSTLSLADKNISVRIYDPAPETVKPVLVYLHGGGHMCGNIELYDPIGRRLATTTEHLVIVVEYSLAPESPYPAALEECQAALDQIEKLLSNYRVDLNKLSIGGDSAGGALASTLASKKQSRKLNKLLLIYPSVDYTCSTDSYDTYAEGYLLETEKIKWYFNHYFNDEVDRKAASPLFFTDLSLMPETLILAAEHDPLVDEGKIFHQKLINAGVQSEYQLYAELFHCFLHLEVLNPELIDKTYQSISEFLNR